MPGVGTGPTSSTSMPMEQRPAVSALSIMYPESLVSLPITMRCLRAESRNTCAAALPMRIAISEVMGSWFATPLTPSVPKSFLICVTLSMIMRTAMFFSRSFIGWPW